MIRKYRGDQRTKMCGALSTEKASFNGILDYIFVIVVPSVADLVKIGRWANDSSRTRETEKECSEKQE